MQKVKKVTFISDDGMEHASKEGAARRDAELELIAWFGEKLAGGRTDMDVAACAQIAIEDAPALLGLLRRIVPPTPRKKRKGATVEPDQQPLLGDCEPVRDIAPAPPEDPAETPAAEPVDPPRRRKDKA